MSKYLVRFGVVYLCVLVASAVASYLFKVKLGNVPNTVALFGGAIYASHAFARANGRVFSKSEYKVMVVGSAAIDAVLQLLFSVGVLAASGRAMGLMVGAIAFVLAMHIALLAFAYSDRMVRGYVPKT